MSIFSPITTSALCLPCDGTPEIQIRQSTLAKIVKLYPEDQAIGYDVNEVRGIWSIEFDRDLGI